VKLSHLTLTLALTCLTAAWASAADNTPPEGFTAVFNGKDLTGWKGLVADPPTRAKMSPEKLAEEQKKADESMKAHWHVFDGALVFDGKGQSLCTAKDFGDCELWLDWKILKDGDSGVYLRGTPQVQIWDPASGPAAGVGSGGLYNNQKNPSKPLKLADKPVGQWNTFRIVMKGDKVTIYLNGELVTDNVTLEPYWGRKKDGDAPPLAAVGPIELQHHGNPLYFKNIYVKELK